MLRPAKRTAVKSAVNLTPQYADLLVDLAKSKGRVVFSQTISAIHKNNGAYVLVYEDENRIAGALMLALMGEEGFGDFTAEMAAASLEERQEFLEGFATLKDDEVDKLLSGFRLPLTAEEDRKIQEGLDAMPEDERKQTLIRGVYLCFFLFGSFFNTLSLMVHGAKLTTLVPQAISGDDEAFLKAIQIDRMLLLHHQYFRDRKHKAQSEGEDDFLRKISYRETNPTIKGKIRFPALYMLFGILDAFHWLDDLRHEEILDICDEAGLDRYQNRIEDVNYLTKQLGRYRNWQKTGGLSMQ